MISHGMGDGRREVGVEERSYKPRERVWWLDEHG
jgi:hypothetical protein